MTAPSHSPATDRSCRVPAPAARANTGARVAYRYRAGRFRAAHQHHARNTAQKRCPRITAIVDWGVTWDEIEPYYTRADNADGRFRQGRQFAWQVIEGGNPFEGRAQRGVSHAADEDALSRRYFRDAAKSLGYHPYAIRRRPSARLHQSRRRVAPRLHLLRILRPLRLHDRRQGAADAIRCCRWWRSRRTSHCATDAGCAASCTIRTARGATA